MAQLHPMKLTEVLAERGLSLESQANGEAPKEIQDREVKKEPTPRANYLRNIYFDTLSSLDVQESYWYTRAATEHEGEVPHHAPRLWSEERVPAPRHPHLAA